MYLWANLNRSTREIFRKEISGSEWLFIQLKFIIRLNVKKFDYTPSAFTCSKLTTETLEQGMKYVQS